MPEMPKHHQNTSARLPMNRFGNREVNIGQREDNRRESAHKRGYDRRWNGASKQYRRDNPLCAACDAVGIVAATEVTDHVIPPKGNMKLFWDKNNRQPCCKWHHDVVKQILEKRFSRGDITAACLNLNSQYALLLADKMRNI